MPRDGSTEHTLPPPILEEDEDGRRINQKMRYENYISNVRQLSEHGLCDRG